MTTFAELFIRQVEDDLKWRENELAILRKQLIQTTVGSAQETTFLRTNLAMIYAHYEGFCKFALTVYIDALEKRNLKRKDLKWHLAAYSLHQFHDELKKEADTASFFSKILTDFDKHLEDKATYERPERIANLWPDLLLLWLARLGLDSTNVLNERTRLETLVFTRNQIAHGKKLTVSDRTELNKHANAAILAMHEVAVGIAYALETESYKRSARVMTIVEHAV